MVQLVVVIVPVLLLDRKNIEVQRVVTEQSPCLVKVCWILMEPWARVGLEVLCFGILVLMQCDLGMVAWEVGLG